jgi:hypothetical protein
MLSKAKLLLYVICAIAWGVPIIREKEWGCRLVCALCTVFWIAHVINELL